MKDNPIQQTQGLCENCLPDATIWATSTPDVGPKSYFVLIKDGDRRIALEVKVGEEGRAVTADVYTPQDYDYTIHDACDHENGECIENDPDFQQQEWIDTKLFLAGYVAPKD
jgi:hypothetical protein